MDEFDSALDAEYRGAVAELLAEVAKSSQFLVTTFRQELIEGADRVFEVGYDENTGNSSMGECDKQRAFAIVNQGI